MCKMQRKEKKIDPRTGLGLLLAANVIAFSQDCQFVEIGWLVIVGVLMMICGRSLSAMKWLVAFGVVVCLQMYILPASPKIIATSFLIFANYTRKLFSCLMVGSLMIHTLSLREMIVGMRSLHVPQKFIIPIAVTLRYFPAIREETGHIRDAMKLRNIHGIDKVEALVVPLMMSASATAEELSAAAVTRGIENPVKKTSLVCLKMTALDWGCLVIAFIFAVLAVIL